MLGKYVRVHVTDFSDGLNYGNIDFMTARKKERFHAYIMGISHRVNTFDGRVIASFVKNREKFYIVAPKSKKFIINDIADAISFLNVPKSCITCLYERSCGAIVFRDFENVRKYLIIKNKRSAHWSFPKGHVEPGETLTQTAEREVLEETGVHINIIPGFMLVSEYTIQGRVEKSVNIYLASTTDTETIIQEEEIEDYSWLTFDEVMQRLKFENDKNIILHAHEYLIDNNI